MDRVRKISELIMGRYPDSFGTDFEENKKELVKVAVVRSKMLRNKIAGYITKLKTKGSVDSETSEEAPEG